jgi:hypothetical protein
MSDRHGSLIDHGLDAVEAIRVTEVGGVADGGARVGASRTCEDAEAGS